MRQTQVRIQSWSVTKSGRKLERLEDLESSQQLWGLEASGNIIQVRIRQGRAFPPTIATKQTEGPSIKTTPSQRDGKNKNILEKKQYRMQDAIMFSDHFFNMKEHHLRLNMRGWGDAVKMRSDIDPEKLNELTNKQSMTYKSDNDNVPEL